MPLLGGSGGGGGPDRGGGGGGGAILVASSQQIVFVGSGRIQSIGGNGFAAGAGPGSGSGGAIRLVAPRIDNQASNVRSLDVSDLGSLLSGGQVRLDATDLSGLRANLLPPAPTTSVGNLMAVFPPPTVTPSLDITRVGPTPIAGGTRVDVTLPSALAATQPVLVHARNLDRATLALAIIPDSGPASFFRVPITGTDLDVTVNATFPLNRAVTLEAWSE
ncbi:MAG: hypothetical protein IT580_11150 [Verrucomicrobiales bacterium]|nr:hypothetical protein [Verrucomicrobiales bacterium]